MMKAIEKMYGYKPKIWTNPFANQENKSSTSNHPFRSKFSPNKPIDELKRRRKYNDMNWDSPTSNSGSNSMSDEEEKEIPQNDHLKTQQNDEKVCENYSFQLLHQLKNAPNEVSALEMIKGWMKEVQTQKSKRDENPPKSRRRCEMEKKISDAIKKLASDNVILKKAIRALVERDEHNAEKVKQFDKLAQAYNQVSHENQQLKNSVEILKYAAREKCDEGMFHQFNPDSNNFDSPGGSGVF